jgi:hypothetical protein
LAVGPSGQTVVRTSPAAIRPARDRAGFASVANLMVIFPSVEMMYRQNSFVKQTMTVFLPRNLETSNYIELHNLPPQYSFA